MISCHFPCLNKVLYKWLTHLLLLLDLDKLLERNFYTIWQLAFWYQLFLQYYFEVCGKYCICCELTVYHRAVLNIWEGCVSVGCINHDVVNGCVHWVVPATNRKMKRSPPDDGKKGRSSVLNRVLADLPSHWFVYVRVHEAACHCRPVNSWGYSI